jgi:hypothetical protein
MKKVSTFRIVSALVILLFFIIVLDIIFFEHKFDNKISWIFNNNYSTALLAVSSSTSTKSSSVTSTSTVSTSTLNILPPESPINYKDNGDGTITDNYTKLIWMKCPVGMSGSTCKSGSPALRSWSDARDSCKNLSLASKKDWRLPTLKELNSIVDTGVFDPSVNKKFFGGTSDIYWTSVAPARYLASKFGVLFSDGSVYFQSDNSSAATRCVRGGN